jgi:hypothetical protein
MSCRVPSHAILQSVQRLLEQVQIPRIFLMQVDSGLA